MTFGGAVSFLPPVLRVLMILFLQISWIHCIFFKHVVGICTHKKNDYEGSFNKYVDNKRGMGVSGKVHGGSRDKV